MEADDLPWNRCHFCGRDSQETVRTCCELGGVADRKYLEPERVKEWETAALEWLPEGSSHYPGDYLENSGEALADVAGRLLCVIDELGRLRDARSLARRFGHQSSRVRIALSILSEPFLGSRFHQVERAKVVLGDESWFYVDRKRHCAWCGTAECDRQGGRTECLGDETEAREKRARETFSPVPVEVVQTTVLPPFEPEKEVERLRAELVEARQKVEQHLATLCAVCDELAEPGDETRLRERLTELLTTDPDEPRDEWKLSSMQRRMLALDVVGQKALRIIERDERRKTAERETQG